MAGVGLAEESVQVTPFGQQATQPEGGVPVGIGPAEELVQVAAFGQQVG
jgi:hypothetical protein